MHLTGPFNSKCLLFFVRNTAPYQRMNRSKRAKVQSHGLAPTLLEGLMPITTEEEPEDIDEDAPSRVCYFLFPLVKDTF